MRLASLRLVCRQIWSWRLPRNPKQENLFHRFHFRRLQGATAMAEDKTYHSAAPGFATRCAMHNSGTFSTPSYHGVGEPYRKDTGSHTPPQRPFLAPDLTLLPMRRNRPARHGQPVHHEQAERGSKRPQLERKWRQAERSQDPL